MARTPRPIPSEDALKDLALTYALRFPGTTERLRTHLHKKVGEAIAALTAPPQARRWIEPVIATLLRVKVLDDALYAEHRAQSLHRRGRSARLITRDLTLKRAPTEAITHAMTALAEVGDDWQAALALARRKRLGPFGDALDLPDREARLKARSRQLGALARAGFSFEIARRIVDAPSRDALED